jgi:hypothetical protein
MKTYYGQVVHREYTTVTLEVPDDTPEDEIKKLMCEQAQFGGDGEWEVYDLSEMEA